MRSRMRLRRVGSPASQALFLTSLAFASGCGDQLPVVALGSLGAERVFLVSLSDEKTTTVRGPFRLDSPSAVSVAPGTTTIVVGISDAAMLAHNETFLSEHVGDMELLGEPVPQDCASGSRLSGDALQTDLPPDTRAMRLADDWTLEALEPELFERLTQKLSVRARAAPRRCTGTLDPSFHVYGDREQPIPHGSVFDGIFFDSSYRDIHRLADGRVLVLSPRHLVLLERGKPFTPTARNLVFLNSPCSGIAVDESPSRKINGKSRVVVSRSRDLVELRLDETGLELVGTATDTGINLGDVTIDAETGKLALAAEGGVVFFQSAHGEPFERRLAATVPADSNDGVLATTGVPNRPFLLSSYAKGLMLIGDGDTWESFAQGLDNATDYKGLGTLSSARGREAWTAGNLGALFRRDLEAPAWTRVRASLPPSLLPCAPGSQKCGWAEPTIDYFAIQTAVAGGSDRIFLSTQNCTAVVSMRPDGQCASYIEFPGPLEGLVEDSGRAFRRLHVGHGWLTAASQAGGVYEVELLP